MNDHGSDWENRAREDMEYDSHMAGCCAVLLGMAGSIMLLAIWALWWRP